MATKAKRVLKTGKKLPLMATEKRPTKRAYKRRKKLLPEIGVLMVAGLDGQVTKLELSGKVLTRVLGVVRENLGGV